MDIVGIYVSHDKTDDLDSFEPIFEQFDECLSVGFYTDLVDFLGDINRRYFQGDYDGFLSCSDTMQELCEEASKIAWFDKACDALCKGYIVIEATWEDDVKQVKHMDLISE